MKTLYRYIDIEVTPATVLMYGKHHDPVILDEVEREKVACISWLDNGGKLKFKGIWDMPSYKGKWTEKAQKELAIFMRELLNEADVIIGHNSDNYDIKKINSECMYYNLEPPKEPKTYDTLKLAGKYLNEPTRKLGYLSPKYGGEGKLSHEGYRLYIKSVAGDKEAQKGLRAYNETDVVEGYKFFERFIPWINRDKSTWDNRVPCPHCGSPETQSRGTSVTEGGKTRKRHQCTDCGKWFLGNFIIKRV